MKLSEKTKRILENYAGINSGIIIRETKPGEKTQLKTIERSGAIYSQSVIDESFPVNVAINDLSALLSVIDKLPDPDIEFHETHLFVKSGSSSVKVVYCDSEAVLYPKNAMPPVNASIEFSMTKDDIATLLSFSNILSLPHIRLFTANGKLVAQATENKNPNSNSYDVVLGDTDKDVNVIIKRESFKMLPGNYTVKVDPSKVALFESQDVDNLVYMVGIEV